MRHTGRIMSKSTHNSEGHELYISLRRVTRTEVSGVEFEVQQIRLPRTAGRRAVQRFLTDQAEYAGWELWRLRRYRDGSREAWLRRKIIRARSTLLDQGLVG